MYRFGLYLAFVAVAAAAPKRCCVDRQFSADLTDVRNINHADYKYQHMSEDFDKKLLALGIYQFTPGKGGVFTGIRVVQDFNTKVQYSITPDNCKKYPLAYDIQGPCIPDYAEYLGSSYFGFGGGGLKYDAYRWKMEVTGANISAVFSQGDCIPILQGVSGIINGDKIDTALTYTAYERNITNPKIFDIPAMCHS